MGQAALALILMAPAAGVAVTGVALAEPPPARGVEKTADEYAHEARRLALKKDFRGAYPLYLEAWRRKKSYDIAGNLAGTELELGKTRDAAEHLAFCVQNFPAIRDAALTKKLESVRELLQKARAKVGAARIRVARDDGGPAERTRVFVDGRPVGQVDANGEVEQPLMASSEVFVDPGSRMFTATYAGCDEGVATLRVAEGGTVDVRLLLLCRSKLSIPLIVTGLGVAAAGVGLGIGATVHSNARSGDADAAWNELLGKDNRRHACTLEANESRCDELEDAHDDSQAFKWVAVSGFVVGGAAAAATVGYVMTWRIGLSTAGSEHQGSPVQAAFRVMPGGGGAVIRGVF
jgi:hypothetical protein